MNCNRLDCNSELFYQPQKKNVGFLWFVLNFSKSCSMLLVQGRVVSLCFVSKSGRITILMKVLTRAYIWSLIKYSRMEQFCNKIQQDRTILLITLYKRFLYNSRSSHITFSSSSSTNTLSFISLLLWHLTDSCCDPTSLITSSLQTFLLGYFTSMHMFLLLLSALTNFQSSTCIKFQFLTSKFFLPFYS